MPPVGPLHHLPCALQRADLSLLKDQSYLLGDCHLVLGSVTYAFMGVSDISFPQMNHDLQELTVQISSSFYIL